MFKNKLLIAISAIIYITLIPYAIFAQWSEEWSRNYNGNFNGNDEATSIALDNTGNVYVTGMADYSSDSYTPITTVKYNSSGTFQWDAIFPPHDANHNGESEGNSIVTYNDGTNTYIYVTGRVYIYGHGYDIVTLKYNTSGTLQWPTQPTYNGSGNGDDYAYKIVVDGDGNAYITGKAKIDHGGGRIDYDYVTIKYRSSDGVEQWVATYDGGKDDIASSLSVDANGNVFVTGTKYENVNGNKNSVIETIKYNSNGVQQWEERFGVNNIEIGKDILVYTNHGVYVTGKSGSNCVTILYAYDGYKVWNSFVSGVGNSIGIYRHDCIGNTPCFYNNIYIAGDNGSYGQLLKYTESSSTPVWSLNYDHTGTFNKLAIDADENITVAGSADFTHGECVTAQYDKDGNQKWNVHHSTGNGSSGLDVKVDQNGICYTTGIVNIDHGIGINEDYLAIKYSRGGDNLNYPHHHINMSEIPSEYNISQNYPNPFNPVTKIAYALPKSSVVNIVIYNILGEKISQLVNEYKEAGYYDVSFNGANLSSGVYFYRITSGGYFQQKKMVLIK